MLICLIVHALPEIPAGFFRLGFTQQAIADKVGYADKSAISKMLKNANFGNFQHFLQQGHPLKKALEVFDGFES